jgi:hypothetical protein
VGPTPEALATGASGQSFILTLRGKVSESAQNWGFDRSFAREEKMGAHLLKPDRGRNQFSLCLFISVRGLGWIDQDLCEILPLSRNG